MVKQVMYCMVGTMWCYVCFVKINCERFFSRNINNTTVLHKVTAILALSFLNEGFSLWSAVSASGVGVGLNVYYFVLLEEPTDPPVVTSDQCTLPHYARLRQRRERPR